MRTRIVTTAILAVAALAVLTVWQLHGKSTTVTQVATAQAVRGDVVVSVGGLGRVIDGSAPTSVAAPTTAAAPTTSAAATSAPPAGAVFASASGHVTRVYVSPGQQVAAGQLLAQLDDGGAAMLAADQARNEIATARLELAQKQRSDPTKGLPPTVAELDAARLAVTVARQKLGVVLGPPTPVDVKTARLEIGKAQTDLVTLKRPPAPLALAAAQLAVDVASRRLAQPVAPATQADVTAAELELKKVQADLEALKTTPAAPSATAIEVAQLAVSLANQKLVDIASSGTRAEILAAQLDLKRAQADLEALQRPAPRPSAAAIAVAELAVKLAQQRLAQIDGPPSPAVLTQARIDLAKAAAELDALQRLPNPLAVRAAERAIALGKAKLAQLLHPAKPAVRNAARLDVAKARSDLGTLRRRGGPASATDVAIARLKVEAGESPLALADALAARLEVRAPANGTVTAVLTSPGSPADTVTPVVTIADLAHLAIRVDLSEFDAARVRAGLPALVSVDALGGRTLPGKVVFEALTGVDNGGVVTFPVRVEVSRVANVKPGMNASVRIIVARRRHVVEVPLEAVSHDGNGHTLVTVVSASGRASTRRVQLGLADNKNVEVKRGLAAGERVVVAGGHGA